MHDIALPERDELARRLREIAGRSPSGDRALVDDLEVSHLVEVASSPMLLLGDVFRDDRLDRVFHWDRGTGPGLLVDLAEGGDLSDESLRKLHRIPDDVKIVGDKCLYDVGLMGLEAHRGHDLIDLGRRSYALASEILEMLSEDRRLREFFRQNRMLNLSIEDEIVFLRQCGDRFTVHAELLRDLGLFRSVARGPNTDRVSHPREGNNVEFRTLTDTRCENVTPGKRGRKDDIPAGIGEDVDSFPNRRSGFAGGMMEERQEFMPDEFRPMPGIADMERLPRKDLLSLYERMLLFSGLDIENLRAELNEVVIDQSGAVESLCDELSLYATGTQSLSRPASYFFVGPTGVGKNHLMESLVRALESRWDVRIPVLQLEGPQYTYPSDINELKGAARGFIRSDEEGILTEFYGRSSQAPFSVILIDEVEKSHPQLRKFFLSLMDRGTTMDNRGQTLNFINTMIIYTSNIGYSRLQSSTAPIGFRDEVEQQAFRNQEVMRDLKRILSPEFVNRLTVIRFDGLSRKSIESIFELEFEKISTRYQAMHGLELTVTPRAKVELIEKGYNPEFGARPMARLLNTVCNIEVSKKLRRDEERSNIADRTLRDYIREVKDGKRAYDPMSMQRRVMNTARVQVPYKGIAVDFDSGDFVYLPQGEERGSH